MKNIKLFLTLLVVSMSSICLTSCGDDEDINNVPTTEPNDTSIIGTWRNTSPTNGNLYEQYFFRENGDYTYVIIENSTTFILEAGTYQLESGVLKINSIRSENPGLTEYNCQINGNNLEISSGQNEYASYSRVENNADNIAGTWECEQLDYDGTYTLYTYVFGTDGTFSYEVPSAFGGLIRESGRYSLDTANGLINFDYDDDEDDVSVTYMLIDNFLIINGLQMYTRTSGGIVDEDDSIVGSWLYEEPGYREIYTFNSNGTFSDTYNDEFDTIHELTGNYETYGNMLTLHFKHDGMVVESETVSFSVSGNLLTLTDSDGDSMILTRIE